MSSDQTEFETFKRELKNLKPQLKNLKQAIKKITKYFLNEHVSIFQLQNSPYINPGFLFSPLLLPQHIHTPIHTHSALSTFSPFPRYIPPFSSLYSDSHYLNSYN